MAVKPLLDVLTVPATDPRSIPVLKHPEHIDEFLLYRLHNLARVATQGVGLMFRRELGISRRDWRILAFVGKYPDASLTQLAEAAALDMVVASRCVANMVKKGLIAKTRLPENKRVTVLALTEAGRIAYEQARVSGQRYNTEFAACLSDEEALLLDGLLKRMEQQAVQLTQREIARSGPMPLLSEDVE
ncbi:MarR family winged helix-turn-helix transcriptional regulator [Paraburkholderia sp.]|uniref:MarR family winged helix-turn-helix transcriptional regulator n=1 Tax=Paraburkholderia sp. TaxID=1926495 RepID=UPI002D3A8FAC|nr:MarR family transcriptional regulator [Paraburkholderia sp.]HZZ04316.1 MarR family transcriptional regulator [Paraburkholderia sp.]